MATKLSKQLPESKHYADLRPKCQAFYINLHDTNLRKHIPKVEIARNAGDKLKGEIGLHTPSNAGSKFSPVTCTPQDVQWGNLKAYSGEIQ